MTFKESFNETKKWDRRVLIVSLYHSRMQLKYGKGWKIFKTAKYFCKSSSYISENLKIAEALQNGLVFTSRKHALKLIKVNNGN